MKPEDEAATAQIRRSSSKTPSNFIGRHRLQAAISHLDQQMKIFQDELNELDSVGGPSTVCDEYAKILYNIFLHRLLFHKFLFKASICVKRVFGNCFSVVGFSLKLIWLIILLSMIRFTKKKAFSFRVIPSYRRPI
ncbi:hypothetical protein RND81_08G184800 [Saponaria officinalis]|uniref:Uncharacterized protein n=1 Tax=Saponaria officinalis TaxID=3572 RepID=A0AAW1J9E2_SAPOF